MGKLKTLKTRVATLGDRILVVQPGSWRSDKSNSHQRGYDHAWRKARLIYLEEHPLCCYCDRVGRVTAASVVDHILPHQGDLTLFWDRSNWQPLCRPCHDGIKKREEAALRG